MALQPDSRASAGWWRRAAEVVWVGWPRLVGVVSQLVAALLRDGNWIRTIPAVAVLVPPASFGAGLTVAIRQSQPLWSFGSSAAFVMALAAGLGAGVAVWAGAGYVIGLLFFFHDVNGQPLSRASLGGSASFFQLRHQHVPFWQAFSESYVGLLVAVLVLLSLGVVTAAVAAGTRALLSPWFRKHRLPRVLSEGVVSTAVLSFGVWQWTLAVQYAIRPYWTFAGNTPNVQAFTPVREHAGLIWEAALAGSALRWLITALRPAPRLTRIRRPRPTLTLWWPLSIAVQALVVTLIASGTLANLQQGRVFGGVAAAGLFARTLVLPRIHGLARVVNAVPLLVRLALVFVVDQQISTWRVGAAYRSHAQSLVSFAQTAAITVAVASLLLVARSPTPWLPGFVARRFRDAENGQGQGSDRPAGLLAVTRPVRPAPGPSSRSSSTDLKRHPHPRVAVLISGVGAALAWSVVVAPPAAADNCSGLTDCSDAAKVGIAAAAALGLLALGMFGLPALVAAGAADAAAMSAAADAALAAYDAAQASAVIASAAAEQAVAAAAAIAEASEAGLIGSEAATAAAEAAAEANAAAWEAAEAANSAQQAAWEAFEASQTGDLAAVEAAQAEAAQAAQAAEAAATDANGAALESEIAGVNPAGANNNCGYVAQAVDDRLAGDAASYADPNGVIDPADLAARYGQPFQSQTATGISNALEQAGDGARGFVAVEYPGSSIGHVINVVEQGGQTFFIDGQSGTVSTTLDAALNGATPSSIWLLPTFP